MATGYNKRRSNYLKQTGRSGFTGKQARRLQKKNIKVIKFERPGATVKKGPKTRTKKGLWRF